MTLACRALRRPTVLIVGCGDVGLRVARLLVPRWRVLALTSSPQRHAQLRAAGVVPLAGDLDDPATLARLSGLAQAVLHLAPTARTGEGDARTAALLWALARRRLPAVLVYGSTTGVYGDCAGAWIDEARRLNPQTARAQRRVAAEAHVRHFGRATGVRAGVLRIPGIYAPGREGGDPRERLARGLPVLAAEDDVYTNHIHADDLARACVAALARLRPQRSINVSDDTELTMGAYFDLAADLAGVPRPPRVRRADAGAVLSPMQLSFMDESRRLDNTRMKRELKLRLRHPTVMQGLDALRSDAGGRSPESTRP